MLISEGMRRSIEELELVFSEGIQMPNIIPSSDAGNANDQQSEEVREHIERSRKREKKRRHRANRRNRLREAEDILAEVAAEVDATNSESQPENNVQLNVMKTTREKTNKEEYRPSWVYDAKIVKGGKQPKREKQDAQVLAVELDISGLKCYTLFDSGSTTNALSPDAAIVSKTPLIELDEPMTLQLGTVGSRSTINYGTHAKATLGKSAFQNYYDIANIDYYDAILGTPFMFQNKVKLDFEHRTVQVNGETHRALTLEQEKSVRRQRRTFRRQIDEDVLYNMDKPPTPRKTSAPQTSLNTRKSEASFNDILASVRAAPPTVPPPSITPPHQRVYRNRNVVIEDVEEED